MKIRYKLWHTWLLLGLGIIQTLNQIYNVFTFGKVDILFFSGMGLSLFFLSIGIYRLIKGYLIIKDGTITTYSLRARTMRLNDVEQYYRDATGDYCLVAGKTKIRINPEAIEKESLEELLDILDEVAVRLN
ncbi:MAG TPA: hypothetical protein DC042_07930 [Bacteroidales bacterium]|nr:hypothetical protein [Bacteroidales bacterium]